MTEEEAREYVSTNVSRGTFAQIEAFLECIEQERLNQNLISAATAPHMWERHVVDSLQLLPLATEPIASWIDVGTGAGFPGMIAAIVTGAPTILIESRKLRTAFLSAVAEKLGLHNISILTARAETVSHSAATILSARAVAALPQLFAAMRHLANAETRWLLPKGRNAASELAEARRTWQGDFAMHPSLTDPNAAIIVASNVRPRNRAA